MPRNPGEIRFGDEVYYSTYPGGNRKRGLILDVGDETNEIQISEVAKFPGEPEIMGLGGTSAPELIILPPIRTRRLRSILIIARRSDPWNTMSDDAFQGYSDRLTEVARLRPSRIIRGGTI